MLAGLEVVPAEGRPELLVTALGMALRFMVMALLTVPGSRGIPRPVMAYTGKQTPLTVKARGFAGSVTLWQPESGE
jgi:hypothetical protein